MSCAERMRNFRDKRKSDAEYKRKESKRIEELRKRRVAKMSEEEKEEMKRRNRWRKRASRNKKTDSSTEDPGTPYGSYKCIQSYSKAVIKSIRSLPQSPNKKRAVFSGMAERIGAELVQKMEKSLSGNRTSAGMNDEEVSVVKEFYYRNDISYTAPGMKDEMVIWEDGQKVKRRKYFLTMFLREAYAVFKASHDDFKIGFSKFCDLRPRNVLLLKDTPLDQCKCKIHENFRLLLKGACIAYDNSWWETQLCETEDLCSNHWLGECISCNSENKLKQHLSGRDFSEQCTWYQWEENDIGRLMRIGPSGCLGELFDTMWNSFPGFREHVRIKRIQNKEFLKDKTLSHKRVLQMDFAMSYSCEYQNEIQSALWSRNTVLLFTAATFFRGECQTYLICSDTPEKGKNTIYAFVNALYETIPQDDAIQIETIFTDGPSSEFKNKYMIKVLNGLTNLYGKPFEWKYFATSHGKGVVDGIGGRAKSLVRTKCLSKSETTCVQSSTDFFKVVQEMMPRTKVIHISKQEIEEITRRDNPWEQIPDAPGIRKVHHIRTASEKVLLYHTSMDQSPTLSITYKKQVTSGLNVGEWCFVFYDGNHYPGKILNKSSMKDFIFYCRPYSRNCTYTLTLTVA